MTNLVSVVLSIVPLFSIFLFGRVFPPGKDTYKPVFQPPNWVFGVVWAYVSIAFGGVTAVAWNKLSDPTFILLFYVLILLGLLVWLPLSTFKRYACSFALLVCLSFLTIGYVVYLSHKQVIECIALLPLPFWLILASCLNGVIYDRQSKELL